MSNIAHPLSCLSCGGPLTISLVDLGLSPLANSYVAPENADQADTRYPLHARVCAQCLLVQVEPAVPREELFSHYAYFSSYSETWLAHARQYAEMAIRRFGLTQDRTVIEIASNDGYLLKNFVAASIPCLGIEPAENIANVAIANGIPTEIAFFGRETARRLSSHGTQADLLIAKNVLAHVPDIDDFVAGVALIMKPNGVFTVEFPHLLNLIREIQFDTIYHEHFTYLSLLAVERIFARHGLRVFDVEEVSTHGGSLRVFACHKTSSHARLDTVSHVIGKEVAARLNRPEGYQGFAERVRKVRDDLNQFLNQAHFKNQKVVAYGAAAKGNTLLNYCGVGPDRILFVADRNPAKQDKFLPGSRIPVCSPDRILAERPEIILILPWNIRDEILGQLSYARSWDCQFVTAIPEIRLSR